MNSVFAAGVARAGHAGRRFIGRLFAIFIVLATTVLTPRCAAADVVLDDARTAILIRAQVILPPAVPIEQIVLGHNSPGDGAFRETDVVSCRFEPAPVGGKTPKFDCRTGTEVLRIRYGRDNPEVYTQVAATRLMSALGFPADRMDVVTAVRCFGCPADPFKELQCLNRHPARRARSRVGASGS